MVKKKKADTYISNSNHIDARDYQQNPNYERKGVLRAEGVTPEFDAATYDKTEVHIPTIKAQDAFSQDASSAAGWLQANGTGGWSSLGSPVCRQNIPFVDGAIYTLLESRQCGGC